MRGPWLASLLALVLLPLGVGAWLSAVMVRQERELVRARVEELALGRLRSIEDQVLGLLEERRELLVTALGESALGPQALRDLERRFSFVGHVVRIETASGDLLHPPLLVGLTPVEESFLRRTRGLWDRRPVPTRLERGEEEIGIWRPFFWQEGLYLFLWWPAGDGTVVGIELDRTRFLADVIGSLPDSGSGEQEGLGGSTRLMGAGGAPLYEWGGSESPSGETEPVAVLSLEEPLAAWSLEALPGEISAGEGLRRAAEVQIFAVLLAVVVAVAGAATFLVRDSRRQSREAEQRVTFVNQVAHELKTPLTNIRLYAELLESRLDDADEETGRYARVVVGESQRLGRLIHNVLDFGRGRRGSLTIRRVSGRVDEVLEDAMERFRPALEARGLELRFDGGAEEVVRFDADALQQIVGNLLSNVEKYAPGSGPVEVSSHQSGDEVVVTVRDRGPGIPNRARSRVFEPFYRVSDALTEGVSGAGIGLALSRELARLHGGELSLVGGPPGACFRLSLHCPPGSPEEEA